MNWPAFATLLLFTLSFASAADGIGLDRLCRGYLRQYRLHHRLAQLTAIALLLHLAREWSALPADDRSMLLDWRDPAMLTAWLACGLLLMLILAAGRYHHWHRRYWLRTHWLLFGVFLLALTHAVLSARPAHRPWLMLLALPALPWLGKYLPAGWWPRFSGWRTTARLSRRSADVVELALPAGSLPVAFRAGQIVLLRFLHLPGLSHQWHPFSVASCRSEAELHLLIRRAGLDTGLLAQAGERIDVALRGPYREWQADFSRPQLWLAGGIGIAPFVGIWHCRRPGQPAPLQILHFTRSDDQLDYTALLGDATDTPPYRRVPGNGMPDWSVLQPWLDQPEVFFLLSGPPGFVAAARQHLLRAGVPRSHIDAERFTV